ncbi:isoleucine--tRNA ligase [Mycoplasma sp. P36-A1]|uniref:isoleucine--tRNA ligase n=1 Tax=Mycoplasma sp. P36-A1 TaxID=3252900 RepID=UPI003C303B09
MNYKDTLLMPKTAFEMKGKLNTKEPKMQDHWREIELYEKVLKSREGNESFVLHDGPPYANGNIHVGHAMNKTIKDIIVRSKQLQGYYSPYVPGWDTHGLPIETAVTKSGINRKEMSIAQFRALCEEYAYKQIENQSMQFQRLGSFGDYKHPYITLQKEYEAAQIRVFSKMAMDGLIYRGLKPVYWSPVSETALAETEIEYHDKVSNSIYVTFKMVDGKELLTEDVKFLCWTTTPWTVPGVLAVALNERIEYGVYNTPEGKLVVAKERAKAVFEDLEYEYELIQEFNGLEADRIVVSHPLYDYDCIVIMGDHVNTEGGTGCVTTAPGHGMEDYIAGNKYELGLKVVVDDFGKMTEEAGELVQGLWYEKANNVIIEAMTEKHTLLKASKFTHSFPYDWRSKTPVIFRATKQWFASIAKKREELLEQINTVEWVPAWGETRLYNMIRDRGDWTISRQRSWGVPIPILFDENKEPIMNEEVFAYIEEKFREHGSNFWFDSNPADLLPQSYKDTHENIDLYTKETDTMDVWFDSGSSSQAVLVDRGLGYPADLYMEGSDQYRGWFNSSLIVGTCATGKAPYKQVLSHGFTLDGKGNKMSKSLGNTIDPLKLINVYGADVLRLWVSSTDYQADVRISDAIMKQVSDAYRKIRNTFKFILGNLNDFTEANLVELDALEDVDKYMIAKLNNIITKGIESYNTYDFNNIYTSVNNFIVKELSAFYMDFTKDILYILKEDSLRRRQVQTVLFHTINSLVMILAPILPHTAEETYSYINKENKLESVHLEYMPKAFEFKGLKEVEEKYDMFMKHREDILKAIEEARESKVVGKSLEASVSVWPKDGFEFIKDIPQLHQLYIVSDVKFERLEDSEELETAYIKVNKFDGYTCPRCWNVVSQDRVVNDLCDRCDEVINH